MIVNADDFGLTPGVCRGVLHAHEAGVVTSTSALAVAPAFEHFVGSASDAGLPMGGHLAIVGEDPPLLSSREVPTLVDATGHFPLRWPEFVQRASLGRVDTDDIRREFAAQLERFEAHGVQLTHLDSHQNLHLWPQVATALIELATERSIPAVRLTRTARWTPVSFGVRVLSRRLHRRVKKAGLYFPAASSGLDEAGALDRGRFLASLERLEESGCDSAEMVTHLAFDPDPDRLRYQTDYRWADELHTVCDPAIRKAIEGAGFVLGSFGDLAVRCEARRGLTNSRSKSGAGLRPPSRDRLAAPPW